MRFLILLDQGDATLKPYLPSLVEPRSTPEGFRSVQRVRWENGRQAPGYPFSELDAEAAKETGWGLYELQPDVVEVRLLDASLGVADTHAVFLGDDLRTLVHLAKGPGRSQRRFADIPLEVVRDPIGSRRVTVPLPRTAAALR